MHPTSSPSTETRVTLLHHPKPQEAFYMAPRSTRANDYQYRAVRLASFVDGVRLGTSKTPKVWSNTAVSAEHLAECGFYYTPVKSSPEQVTCFWCGKRESRFLENTELSELHLENSPACPLSLILLHLGHFVRDSDKESFWTRLRQKKVSLAVINPLSKESTKLRLSTFKTFWKFDSQKSSKVTSRSLAEAGFFYSPIDKGDDRVICMYCDCPLSEWDASDDPIEEHKRNSFVYCEFIHVLEHGIPKEPRKKSKLIEAPEQSLEFNEDVPGNDIQPSSPLATSKPHVEDSANIDSPGSEPKSRYELDAFDFSIEELMDNDKNTIFAKDKRLSKKYARQPTRTSSVKKEPDKKSSLTSLVLQVRDEKDTSIGSSASNKTSEESKDDQYQHATYESPTSAETTKDSSYADMSASYRDSSSFQSRDTKKSRRRLEGRETKVKVSRSQFSDDDFGINEDAINEILNSPKKLRKITILHNDTKEPAPIPSAIFNDSNQNLGDYDETNISFMERDVQPTGTLVLSEYSRIPNKDADFKQWLETAGAPQKDLNRELNLEELTSTNFAPESVQLHESRPESTAKGESSDTANAAPTPEFDVHNSPIAKTDNDEHHAAEDMAMSNASLNLSDQPLGQGTFDEDQKSLVLTPSQNSDVERKPLADVESEGPEVNHDSLHLESHSPSLKIKEDSKHASYSKTNSPRSSRLSAKRECTEDDTTLQSSPNKKVKTLGLLHLAPVEANQNQPSRASEHDSDSDEAAESSLTDGKISKMGLKELSRVSYKEYMDELKGMSDDFVDASVSVIENLMLEPEFDVKGSKSEAQAPQDNSEADAPDYQDYSHHAGKDPNLLDQKTDDSSPNDKKSISEGMTGDKLQPQTSRVEDSEVNALEVNDDFDMQEASKAGEIPDSNPDNLLPIKVPTELIKGMDPDNSEDIGTPNSEKIEAGSLSPSSTGHLEPDPGNAASFQPGLDASTPERKIKPNTYTASRLSLVNIDGAVKELNALEESIENLAELITNRYELHNDAEGALTNFIAAMPEEDEKMSISEWILHNAFTTRKTTESTAERLIADYEEKFDKVIEYVESLQTID